MSDLVYYDTLMAFKRETKAIHSVYEYVDGLRYKFTTFLTYDSLSKSDMSVIAYLIEVMDANNHTTHFEMTNEFEGLQGLHKTQKSDG